jgi:hypothetical protein
MLRGAAAVAMTCAVTLASVSTADARPRHHPRISRLTVGTRLDSVTPRPPAATPPREPPPPSSTAIAPPEPATVTPPAPPLRLTEPPPAPPRRWGQLTGGIVLFLAGYSADLGLSYGLGPSVQRPWLAAIPLVGPLVQMGENWSVVSPSQTGNPQVDSEANLRIAEINRAAQTAAYAVLAIDFGLQFAGLTMAIVGALPPRRARSASDVTIAPSSTGRAALTVSF